MIQWPVAHDPILMYQFQKAIGTAEKKFIWIQTHNEKNDIKIEWKCIKFINKYIYIWIYLIHPLGINYKLKHWKNKQTKKL